MYEGKTVQSEKGYADSPVGLSGHPALYDLFCFCFDFDDFLCLDISSGKASRIV